MKKLLTTCLIVITNVIALSAQSSTVGTAGAQFLKIQAGARGAAMKGAFVAVTDDANSLFWNPAGISQITNQTINFSNIQWWADISVNQFAFAKTISGLGTFGFSVMNVAVPEQEVTTVDDPDGTGRFFDASDLMLGLSYSRFLTAEFSFGLNAKYINQRIWNTSASTIAFDLGTQYKFGFNDVVLGMAIRNFGTDMLMDGEDLATFEDRSSVDFPSRRPRQKLETLAYPIPLNFQVGIAGKPFQTQNYYWLVSADIMNPSDNNEQISFGSELAFLTQFSEVFLRGGYVLNNPEESWAAGLGTRIKLTSVNAVVDFSYSEHKYLSAIQRITFTLEF